MTGLRGAMLCTNYLQLRDCADRAGIEYLSTASAVALSVCTAIALFFPPYNDLEA